MGVAVVVAGDAVVVVVAGVVVAGVVVVVLVEESVAVIFVAVGVGDPTMSTRHSLWLPEVSNAETWIETATVR